MYTLESMQKLTLKIAQHLGQLRNTSLLTSLAISALVALQALIGGGCSKNNVSQTPNTSSSQSDQGSGHAKVVHLAAWSSYVNLDILKKFEAETGTKVEISNYSSNEELLAKLQAGATGFDVAIPSDYMVYAMSKLGLLEELNAELVPHRRNLSSDVTGRSYDPEGKFSVPYTWGTTGIAIRTDRFKGKISGYKDLFENKELSGHFSLLDDAREGLGAGLKRHGLSLNSRSGDDIARAKSAILSVRKGIKAFSSESLNLLVNGEVAAAQAYSCDAYQAKKKSGGKIDFIIPVEGCTLWVDNLVIPKGARDIATAHRLINFLIGAENSRLTASTIMTAPANRDAIPLLAQAFLKEYPNLLPAPPALKKCEMMEDLGDAIALYDRAWTEVKVARGGSTD